MRTVHLSTSERAAYGANRAESLRPDYLQSMFGGVPIGRPIRVRKCATDITPRSIELPAVEAERLATWAEVLP
jgi:hypothetical protein